MPQTRSHTAALKMLSLTKSKTINAKREKWITNLLFDNFQSKSVSLFGLQLFPQERITLKLTHQRLNLQKKMLGIMHFNTALSVF